MNVCVNTGMKGGMKGISRAVGDRGLWDGREGHQHSWGGLQAGSKKHQQGWGAGAVGQE